LPRGLCIAAELQQETIMTGTTPDSYTLQITELPCCTHTYEQFKAAVTPLVRLPPTQAEVAAIEAGLRAMIAQIDADRKARPVHAAIEATRQAYRSDGQPPRYYDPLLKD
jgi:hypothetical protein